MQIVTLGPKGTFSEEAALIYQKRISGQTTPENIRFSNIFDCLQAVESYQADRAVLPAENMVDGIIGITFDALIEFHDFIKVNDEVHVNIKYVLAGQMEQPRKVKKIFFTPFSPQPVRPKPGEPFSLHCASTSRFDGRSSRKSHRRTGSGRFMLTTNRPRIRFEYSL